MEYHASLIGKNGKEYAVGIVTGGDNTAEKELTLLSGGIVIEYASESNVFRAVRGSGATISIYTDVMPTDIWTGTPMGTPVLITEDGEPLWCGYATPNTYSQNYSPGKEQLDIECRDLISTLQDIRYTRNDRGYDTIEGYLNRAIAAASNGIFDIKIKYIAPFSNVALSQLAIMDANWFDESGEPEMWSRVVEYILQWCGLTLIQWRDTIVVQDIRQFRNASVSYIAQEQSGGEFSKMTETRQLLALDNYTVNAMPKYSLSDVYQRVKIKVSMYNDTSVLPNWWDDDASLIESHSNYVRDYRKKDYYENTGFYMHPKVTQFCYDRVTSAPAANPEYTWMGLTMSSGGFIAKHFSYGRSNTGGRDPFGSGTTNRNPIPTKQDMKNYILIMKNEVNMSIDSSSRDPYNTGAVNTSTEQGPNNTTYEALPMLTLSDDAYRAFGGDLYLVVSGDAMYSCDPYPMLNADRSHKIEDKTIAGIIETDIPATQGEMYIDMKIRVGDKYASHSIDGMGTATNWDTNSNNRVRCYLVRDNKEIASDATEGEWYEQLLKIRNNVTWEMGLDIEGLALSIGADSSLSGKLEITLLGIHTPVATKGKAKAYVSSMWLQNLNVGIYRRRGVEAYTALDNDVTYSNIINDNNAKEFSDLTLHVATDLGRSFARAAVLNVSSGSISYQGKVTSSVTGESAEAERHLVAAMVEQYKHPRRILSGMWRGVVANPTIGVSSDAMGGNWIINGAKIDVDNTTSELELTELI